MELSWKRELFCWITGTIGMAALFVNSHTFYVTRITFYYGAALLAVFLAMAGLRFRKRRATRPTWLKVVSNLAFLLVGFLFVMYLLGVGTFYE